MGRLRCWRTQKMVSSCTWLQKKKKQVHMRTVTECKGLHLPTYLMLMHKLSVRICQWMIEFAQLLTPLYIEETHLMEGHAMQGLIQSHLNFYFLLLQLIWLPWFHFIWLKWNEMKSLSRFHLAESRFQIQISCLAVTRILKSNLYQNQNEHETIPAPTH